MKILQFFFVLQQVVLSATADNKRLLLKDPDVLAYRLNQLENTIQQLTSTVQKQSTTIDQLQLRVAASENDGGSTYVRWGRKSCPNDTEIVYSGYVGGGPYNYYGSAAEHVCLTHETVLGVYKPSSSAWMYGGEYEKNFDGVIDDDAPCTVCLNKNVHSTIMIPGTNKCYSGWRMEYHGVLASGANTDHAASSFICVDENRETVDGGSANENGKRLFTVIGKCGSLKCPPYQKDHELTCVVCSK